jgi:lysozyme family protein
MADFKIAVQKTLVHEGGYVNNPNDNGGPTKYGITQADMPGVNIADITTDQAIAYYSEHYWKPLYSQINDQLIAEKLFDMGVLFGIATAVKMLQFSMQPVINLVSDGNFGPNTLNATNTLGKLDEYKKTLIQHAVYVAVNHPHDAGFLLGWQNRINS